MHILISLFLLTLMSCAVRAPKMQEPAAEYNEGQVLGYADADQYRYSSDAPQMPMALMKTMAAPMEQAEAPPLPPQVPPTADVVTTTPGVSTGRMLYYEGGISLKSAEPKAVLDSLERYALALGGYVQSRSGNSVTLRVPVARFRESFDAVQRMGETLQKWMSAADITEEFQDNELRLRIAVATLGRLQELLAASTSDQEKMELLREIKRVTDQIEILKTTKRVLEQKASFSQLSVDVQPYVFQAQGPLTEIGAFAWFAKLDPMRTKEPRLGKKLCLNVPEGFAEVDIRKMWAAGAPDGAQVWGFRRRNEPMGDAVFWRKALSNAIGHQFAKVDTLQSGSFDILRVQSHGAEPYIWYIAFAADGKKLLVAEAWFPNQDSELRHRESVLKMLKEGVQ